MIDVEFTVRAALAEDFPAQRVCTELPAEDSFNQAIAGGGIIRAVGGPGGNVNRTLERALVDVDVLAADRDAARELAELVRDWFIALAHTFRGGAAFTLVETTLRPHYQPWDNTDVRRFTASYQLYCTAT